LFHYKKGYMASEGELEEFINHWQVQSLKKGEEPWKYRPEGIPIYHKSWIGHGMKTGSAPLLALYLWRGGNLTQKSIIN
jgi:hypothetical protein